MGGSVIAAIVAGVFLTAVAFAHSVGPALFLLAVTPFDAIPHIMFGVAGNLITFVPILILLVRTNPMLWGQMFFGTRLQMISFVFVLALLVAHAAGIMTHGLGEILDWLRFVTLFVLMGIFAWSMQKPEHILIMARVMVLAMAALTMLSAIDFYLGIQVLPVKIGEVSSGALERYIPVHETLRFTGAAFPVNRYANYLLPCMFLGVGWFMRAKQPFDRLVAISATGILIFAELLTVSRSGLLGMAIGAVLLLPLAFGVGVRQAFGLVAIGGILGLLISVGLEASSASDALGKRFGGEMLGGGLRGRLLRWYAAILIWSDAPFIGVGWGHFTMFSGRWVSEGGLGAHNSYLRVLAEGGLLAFIPLIAMLGSATLRLLRRVGHLSPGLEFWRPYFLCALVAQMVSIFFNDYFAERYLWFTLSFAIVLERLVATDRRRVMRERRDVVRNFGGSPVADAGS